jgi:hypothetical protein
MLDKIVLQRLGLSARVRMWSPNFRNYFEGMPEGLAALVFIGFMGADLLLEALYDARVVEKRPGLALEIWRRAHAELLETIEEGARGDVSAAGALIQVASGQLYGVSDLLARAADEFAAAKEERDVPTVLLVGEIYVRCEPFANDFVADKLEQRGIRVRFAPFNEWIEYADYINYKNGEMNGIAPHLSSFTRAVIQSLSYGAVAEKLGWPHRTTVKQSLAGSAPYMRELFQGESVLTLGGPVAEYKEGIIDGVVSVGPLECMPNKVSEAQFFHIAEKEGLLSLTLSLNGDPMAPEALENFIFEVRSRFEKRPRRERAKPRETQNPLQVLGEAGFTAARQAMKLAAWAFPAGPQGFQMLKRLADATMETIEETPVEAERSERRSNERPQ